MQPLRIGIVGAGYIADIIAGAIGRAAGVTLGGVASRRRERAEALAQAHAIPQVFDSWEALVAAGTLDAVYVATPTAVRAPICIAAARHGKHVLAEKPFADLASLREILAACREAGVAFLDATHFVHHPRTARIKHDLAARVGRVQAIASSFFFPSSDPENIRFDPAQEPTGAYGDMAWYTMRAAVEFCAPDAQLNHAGGIVERDRRTGAVVRTSGFLSLSDGVTLTWNAGYTVGTLVMDLAIMGDRGVVVLDDFVLDWAGGFPGPERDEAVGFRQRGPELVQPQPEFVATPDAVRQSTRLIEQFARLAADPAGAQVQASMAVSERTQALLDTVWERLDPL